MVDMMLRERMVLCIFTKSLGSATLQNSSIISRTGTGSGP